MPSPFEQHFADTFGRAARVIARAPGRIEFIGNHVDYNGGSVLGVAVDREVLVGLSPGDDAQVRIRSTSRPEPVHAGLNHIVRLENENRWANYPLGVLVLLRAAGLPITRGFDLLVHSAVPEGAGLSSSAALELATAVALTKAAGGNYTRESLAILCQRAENEFVGVPCGILDQGVSAFGRRDHLVHIDCRGPSFSTVPLPSVVSFWLFNTHSSHALVDSLYAARHAECMEALERLRPHQPAAAYLTDVSPAVVMAHQSALPDPLYRRALHVVCEQQRVAQTKDALAKGDLTTVGRLLTASHESSRDLFENSTPELDFLVDALRNEPDVLGARLTGGGFGGAVMALTNDRFTEDRAGAVAARFAAAFGRPPAVLQCASADGAGMVEPGA